MRYIEREMKGSYSDHSSRCCLVRSIRKQARFNAPRVVSAVKPCYGVNLFARQLLTEFLPGF